MRSGRTFQEQLSDFAIEGRRRTRRGLGFTMLELMVVITIIMILLGIGGGMYRRSIERSKEAALKEDLRVMRQCIDRYTLDKEQAPGSLDDLVAAQYLREVPTDPFTNKKDWNLVFEDVQLSPDQTGTGITDVHSNSELNSPFEGTAYSSW